MLYITAKINGEELSETWWVDSQKPWQNIDDITIIDISADGDELGFIRDTFKNIPDAHTKRVVVWKGEFARFIYDNLTSKKMNSKV